MGDRSFAAYYESLPKESQWSSEDREQIGLFIGSCISNEISIPTNSKGKTVIFSSSSNVGVMENGIQSEAGDNYLVIANDTQVYQELKVVFPFNQMLEHYLSQTIQYHV